MNFTKENTVGLSDAMLAELNDEFNERIAVVGGGVVDYETRLAIFADMSAEVAGASKFTRGQPAPIYAAGVLVHQSTD
jgi:hypothetical protein